MTKHALLSPSSAHRWMECPGSVALHARDVDGDCAIRDEGTAMHEIACRVLRGAQPNALAYMGSRIIDDRINVEITEEHCDLVQEYVDAIRFYEIGSTASRYEAEVNIGEFTGEEGAIGTVDCAIVVELPGDGGSWELQVHDLKTGFTPVSPVRNKQLMLYALPLATDYETGAAVNGYLHPARIRLVIHRPRIYSAPQEWVCSMADLRAFAEEVKRAAERAHKVVGQGLLCAPPEAFSPGVETCTYCSAKADCKALEESVYAAIGASSHAPQTTIPAATQAVVDTSPGRLAAQYLAIPLIEMFCKAVTARAYSIETLPGLKKVAGRLGARKWSDPEAAANALKKMRYRDDEMYKQTVISPTAAEKMLKASSPKRWAKLDCLITRAEGRPVLVPESDPREAIRPVLDVFNNLDNDIGDLL